MSAVEDVDAGRVDVHVTSDLQRATTGKVRWVLTSVAGDVVAEAVEKVRIGANGSKRAFRIDLRDPLQHMSPRNLLLWLSLDVGGETVSENLVTLARPKHLELTDPKLRAKVRKGAGGSFEVTVSASAPALWAWWELARADCDFSDSFVSIRPGAPVTLTARPQKEMTKAQFVKQLRLRSLVDTY